MAAEYLEKLDIKFNTEYKVFICVHENCRCIIQGDYLFSHLRHKNHQRTGLNKSEFLAHVKAITDKVEGYGRTRCKWYGTITDFIMNE